MLYTNVQKLYICAGAVFTLYESQGTFSCKQITGAGRRDVRCSVKKMTTKDSLLLWNFLIEERLGDTEALAILCHGCELLLEKLNQTPRKSDSMCGEIYENFIVSDRRLELSETGLVFNPSRKIANVRDYLPPRMKPLLELTSEDLGRVAVFSLAKLVLANTENIKSQSLYTILSSILHTHLSTVPELPTVSSICQQKMSLVSAKRILSSMFFKYQGRCSKEYGARNFSTIRSLPSLAIHSNFDDEETINNKKMNSFMSQSSLIRRQNIYEPSVENEQSISGVCSYVRSGDGTNSNSSDVFNLLDLPGLKYNRNSVVNTPNQDQNPKPTYDHKSISEAQREKTSNQPKLSNRNPLSQHLRINMVKDGSQGQIVRIILLNNDVMEVTLNAKEVSSNDLLKISLEKLQIDPNDFHLFCLCKRTRGEFLFMKSGTKMCDVVSCGSVSTFYVRLCKPPGIQLKKLYSKYFQESNNFGVFHYQARESRTGRNEEDLKLSLDILGLRLNDKFVAWKEIKQVSFSHTYLLLAGQLDSLNNDQKLKISFTASKTKYIYDLILFLINANKEAERTKEKEMNNLDDLCDQLMKITRTALKVMTTPNRKRTKSTDPDLSKSASKKQKLNPNSLGFSERKKRQQPQQNPFKYQYKLYLENEEDEVYVHCDQLKVAKDKENTIPRTKTRITTNPKMKIEERVLKQPFGTHAPRQGPVIMGTSTLKRKRSNNNEVGGQEASKKIVCVSMSKMELLSLKMEMTRREENIFIDSILFQQSKKKLLIGDKIIAVNGKTLEKCSLEKANFIVANAGHLINFILQR